MSKYTEAYLAELRKWGDPDNRSPAYVQRNIRMHCDEAAKRFCDDPERVKDSARYFLIRADHHWHGEVQELVQVNASRELIKEVFAEGQAWNGIELTCCEELVRFKLLPPAERKGLLKLAEEAERLSFEADGYMLERAAKLIRRLSQGYDV